MSILTDTYTRIDIDEDVDTSDNEDDFDDWYALKLNKTNPNGCPCCGVKVGYAHVSNLGTVIVVWPSEGDKMLLKCFGAAQRQDMGPEIVPYEISIGPCISFYNLPR
jgi:hypothetical protein